MSNILLINDNVQDYQTIIDACKDNTYAITYNQGTDTYDSILKKYENIVLKNNIQLVNHLALVSHGSINPEFTFLEKENKMLISQYLPDISNCASCQTNETEYNDLSLNNIDELFDNTPDIHKCIVDLSLNITQEEFDTKETYTYEEIISIFKDVSNNVFDIVALFSDISGSDESYPMPYVHELIQEFCYTIPNTSHDETFDISTTDLYLNTPDIHKYIVDLSLNITPNEFVTNEIYTITDIGYIFKDASCNILGIIYDNELDLSLCYYTPTIDYLIMESYDYKIRDTSDNYTLTDIETDNYESGVLDVLTGEAISITTDNNDNTRNNPTINSNYSPGDIEDVSSKSSTNRYILNNLDSWNAFKEFIKKFNIQNSLDFLGCALLQSNNWRYTLNMLQTAHHLNLNIRASDDDTGNLKVGGDWILESDNVNIKELYFHGESIERWKYILQDSVAISNIKINYNNINAPLSLGETKLSNLAGVEYEIIVTTGPHTSYQTQYTTPGDFIWTCPANIYSVCVVCCGGGGGGMYYNHNYARTYPMQGGGGGGLGWKNNIAVTPGNSYPLRVGVGGSHGPYNTGSTAGGESFFINNTTVRGGGGSPGRYNNTIGGGTFVGDGGGNGGGVSRTGTGPAGGGGAGGYTGNGGTGSNPTANPGSGGGGASGRGGYGSGNTSSGNTTKQSTGGGGVGYLGEGPSGSSEGAGGSGGGSTIIYYDVNSGRLYDQTGGQFGGGGGGSASSWKLVEGADEAGDGGSGFVRIIAGDNRSYPNTNTADMFSTYYIDIPVTAVIPSTNINFSTLHNLNIKPIINMKPTMTITASGSSGGPVSDGGTTNDTYLTLTFTSSEPTTNFAQSDINVTNGTLANFQTLSSTQYTTRFNPSSLTDGTTHTIDVLQGAYTNNKTTIGCQNAATQFNWTYAELSPEYGHFNTTGTATIYGLLSGASVSPSGYNFTTWSNHNINWSYYSMGSEFLFNTAGKIIAVGAQNINGGNLSIFKTGVTSAARIVAIAGTGNVGNTIQIKYYTLSPPIIVAEGEKYRTSFKNTTGGYPYTSTTAYRNTNTTSGNITLRGGVYVSSDRSNELASYPSSGPHSNSYAGTDIIFSI